MDQPPVTVLIYDLEEIGMDDVWHVDEQGDARRCAGFPHQLGRTFVEDLYDCLKGFGGGHLIYDPNSTPYTLELVLH